MTNRLNQLELDFEFLAMNLYVVVAGPLTGLSKAEIKTGPMTKTKTGPMTMTRTGIANLHSLM